jgi:transglutaminase-like putative cysteine protease
MRVRLRHNTTYRFDRSVMLGPHDVRLRPSAHCRTPILDYSLRVGPAGGSVFGYTDAAGNWVTRFLFPRPATELRFDVELVADLAMINPFHFLLDLESAQYPFRYPEAIVLELAPVLNVDSNASALSEWVERVKGEFLSSGSINTVTLLVELNLRIQREITYIVRDEPGVQTPDETLERAAGSCRDSGWLLVQVLRHLGLAARFVSGYLIQPASGSRQEQANARQEQTRAQPMRADLHAWAEVFIPGAGWIGLDPTSGLLCAEGHIPVAVARVPEGTVPVEGSSSPTEDQLSHRLEVEPA